MTLARIYDTTPAELIDLEALAEQAFDYAQRRRSSNTSRGYASDWRQFEQWCACAGRLALPADDVTVALYLTARARELRVATLQRHLAAVAAEHRDAGHPVPHSERLAAIWTGIRRTFGTAQHGKEPLMVDELRRICAALPATPLGVRDRALLLVGFAGAFRRSELVGLDVDDVTETTNGLIVTLRRSKTDQEGAGRDVGIPYGSDPLTCPVRAWRAWVELLERDSGKSRGPLFRPVTHGTIIDRRLSAKTVALVVKRHCERVGLDPAQFAAHSLRAGLCTSAALAGASERSIAATTGHKSMAVLRRYIRPAGLFVDNAAAACGL